MTKRQLLGIIGSAILFIGVFMPIVKLPVVGEMNYFHNGRGDGVIILARGYIIRFRAHSVVSPTMDHVPQFGSCLGFRVFSISNRR
jgi:hypothetical protein